MVAVARVVPISVYRKPIYLDYTSSLAHPLDILLIDSRLESIVMALEKVLPEINQLSLFGSNSIRTTLEDIAELVFMDKPLYLRWKQVDANGKERDLAVPKTPLENLFVNYLVPMLRGIKVHSQCHGAERGFTPSESIRCHLPIGVVLSFDISGAFKNVDVETVFRFYYNILDGEVIDVNTRTDVAGLLTSLSTVYYSDTEKMGLPQGSQVSPFIFNRILHPVDEALITYAEEHDLVYTRWLDDFIISSRDVDCNPAMFYRAIGIVSRHYPIAENKVFLQTKPPYFLLGHKVVGNGITKVKKEVIREYMGKVVSPEVYWRGEDDDLY